MDKTKIIILVVIAAVAVGAVLVMQNMGNGDEAIESVNLTINVDSNIYSEAKLKTGDTLLASANSYDRQHSKGIIIGTSIDPGQESQHSTELVKAEVWFKDNTTGEIINKTMPSEANGYNIEKFDWIDGYVPYKAQVWYKSK